MAGRALESAKKAATTAKVKKYNQAMKDAGAPDDYNIKQSDFRNIRNMEQGLNFSPGWPSNKQWDGNEWSSPSPATNIVGAVGKAAKMAAKAAQSYKLAEQREAMKKSLSEMGKMAETGGARPNFQVIGQAGQKFLKEKGIDIPTDYSNAIGQKRGKLRAGPDTNYDRRDPDSYFYDEDFAADAGPRKSREELQEQRNEAIKAKINKQN